MLHRRYLFGLFIALVGTQVEVSLCGATTNSTDITQQHFAIHQTAPRIDYYLARLAKAKINGKSVFKKRCSGCHVSASRFIGYTKPQILSAIRTIPTMSAVKVPAAELTALVKYLKTAK